MLNHLHISNYALIDELDVSFTSGFNCITGETGAGKSILLGAIGLILGNRADTKVLFDRNIKCVVEAHFNLENGHLKDLFDAFDWEYESQLIIRREINPSGKSRAFVNDSPVVLSELQKLSMLLVDLHQQFDTRNLNDSSTQLEYLDALAGNQSLLTEYKTAFTSYKNLTKDLRAFEQQEEEILKEKSFLEYQLEEFQKWNFTDGEQEKLEDERELLSKAEDIKRVFSNGHMLIREADGAIIEKLNEIRRDIDHLALDAEKIVQLTERYSASIEELNDISLEFEDLNERTEYDPDKLLETEERLNGLYQLQQKHNAASIQELIKIEEDSSEKLLQINKRTGDTIKLKRLISKQEAKLNEISKALSKNRITAAKEFESKIDILLTELNMEHAQLKVQIEDAELFLPHGKDVIQFLFATNKGSEFLPIKQIASGGELSRLSLCIKSLVAATIDLPTLIFDEIDTGVSGSVSMKMGSMLKELATHHQVLNITHSPQIASKASTHFYVEKQDTDERTYTRLTLLNAEDRIIEIAKNVKW